MEHQWADEINDSLTKRLMFQVLFFPWNLAKFFAKTLSIYFLYFFFYKITKMKIKSFECPKSIRNYEKKNTWNVRHLVDESFVPSVQQTSVLYCRLTDFKIEKTNILFAICPSKIIFRAKMSTRSTRRFKMRNQNLLK